MTIHKMNDDAYNFLGLIHRAGKLVTGTDLVISAVRSGKVSIVLVDGSVSSGTLKKVTDKCKFYKIDWIHLAEVDVIGSSIGKKTRKVIGITDKNMAKVLLEKLKK